MKPTDFAVHLGNFLTAHLPAHRGASANTVKAYRDAFSLFLSYCRDHKGMAPESIRIEMLKAELVLAFLEHLEKGRGCGKSTVNQRLAAFHSFFRYLQVEEPQHIAHCQRILAIPFRRAPRASVSYLSRDDLGAVLKVPDLTSRQGRRDAVLLSLLYDCGARAQELIDLTVKDVRLQAPAQVRLLGKGGKRRVVPLMAQTAATLKQYLKERALDHPDRSGEPVFQNRWGDQLTRSGLRWILAKYVEKARPSRPSLPAKITPHTLRHTKAMHLLQTGNPLVIIRDILGHTDIKTTEIYARADLEMRREALKKAAPQSPAPDLPSWLRNPSLLEWLRSLQGLPQGSYVESTVVEVQAGQRDKEGNST